MIPSVLCQLLFIRKKLSELKEEISNLKAKLSSGEQPVFDKVDVLFHKLEVN